MRSRYSAYYLGRVDYLVETTHPSERNPSLRSEVEETLQRIKWTSLKVLSSSQGHANDKIGKVEFVAEYEIDGESKTHQERSRFRRFEGRWRYRDDQG
jgi:SEC-C motif-containing protein